MIQRAITVNRNTRLFAFHRHLAICATTAAWLLAAGERPAMGEQTAPARAANLVLFVGDGMGMEQVRAAHYWLGSNLSFETWSHTGTITTASANSPVTDSAAAATAMATGTKVDNGVISVALPGNGANLRTVLEYFKSRGKRTGLVTTSYMTDATPAAFAAHAPNRADLASIASCYLNQTRPNVLFGGGSQGLTIPDARAAQYLVVSNRYELLALVTPAITNVSGQFGAGALPYEYDGVGEMPHLSQMTATALAILTNSPSGFFLLIEAGRIDHACHANDIARTVPEVIEFDKAIAIVAAWAATRTDTLLVVTGDHETGGLQVSQDNGPGNLPGAIWSTTGHTDTRIGIWATGAGSARIAGRMDNTQVCAALINASLLPATCQAINNSVDTALIQTEWNVASGEVYRVDCTPHLANDAWQPVTIVTSRTSTAIFAHTNATANASLFYRLIALPE